MLFIYEGAQFTYLTRVYDYISQHFSLIPPFVSSSAFKGALEIPSCSRVKPERKRRKVRPELPSVSTTHVSTEEVDPGAERMQETEAMEVRETEEDMPGTFEGTKECASCCVLQSEKRQLRNTVNTLRG